MDLSTAAREALSTLRIDRTTALVTAALRDAGIDHVLLKGPSTAQWLYPEAPLQRSYVDTDLLIGIDALSHVLEVLQPLGLEPPLGGASATEQDGHSVVLRPQAGSALGEVDVHFTLPGVGRRSWSQTLDVLRTHSGDTVRVLGQDLPALDLVGRAAVVVLHAARNGPADARSTEDLRRCLAALTPGGWNDVLQLCRSLDAVPALSRGLELLPAGQDLARHLGIEGITSVEMQLRRAEAPAMAYGLARLSEADSLSERLRLIGREIWPTPAFLDYWAAREHLPDATVLGRRRQRAAYLMRGASPALRAWRQARRT